MFVKICKIYLVFCAVFKPKYSRKCFNNRLLAFDFSVNSLFNLIYLIPLKIKFFCMKYLLRIFLFFISVNSWSQVDYSSNWQDHYSYNNVVDFVHETDVVYALTENAVFTYDLISDDLKKFSSINGMSGTPTSTILYSSETKKIIIGYDNGLLEIIDKNGSVQRIVDILLSDISTEKRINGIYEYENNLYLSLPFGIVVYDMLELEFGETFFIGEKSTPVDVNDIIVYGDFIYAASSDGIYLADFSSNLNDSNNWSKISSGEFRKLTEFNQNILISKGVDVFALVDNSTLRLELSVGSSIVDINSNFDHLNIATSKQGFIYDINYNVISSTTRSSSINISSIYSDNDFIYLGSNEKGVLKSSIMAPDDYEEFHPPGPVSNVVHSITVNQKEMWVVYGGYDSSYTPSGKTKPIDYYDGQDWTNIPIEELTIDNESPPKDLIQVTVDPRDSGKIYVSSWAAARGDVASLNKGGILVMQNNSFFDFWHSENSGLSHFNAPGTNYNTTRIGGTVFDEEGNMWVANSLIQDDSGGLKKLSTDGEWSDHVLIENLASLVEIVIDESKNVWIGSSRNGLLVYNEEGKKKAQLTAEKGGLPERVQALAVGIDDNIWIGTLNGLVLFSDVENIFSSDFEDAEPVIIEENGVASILLDGANINDILVDGAGNIWFATSNGGVLKTNSTGKVILEGFNKDNSPLPTNRVLKIEIDESTGTVYFATSEGIVSYNTGVASYGDELTDVYAYPNPALKQHSQISITGKSSNFPLGTNIKILDVAGNLVFESNAIESQSDLGGKFVWDKTNLAGSKVASGVYIVLLFDAENNQTASAKIAIIN